jgi:hypothetical protein
MRKMTIEMRKVILMAALLLLAINIAVAASITSLSPRSGPVGTPVTIKGSNFGSSQGTSTVRFNGTTAVVVRWSATTIVVKVPEGAMNGEIVVTVSGESLPAGNFSVTPTR